MGFKSTLKVDAMSVEFGRIEPKLSNWTAMRYPSRNTTTMMVAKKIRYRFGRSNLGGARKTTNIWPISSYRFTIIDRQGGSEWNQWQFVMNWGGMSFPFSVNNLSFFEYKRVHARCHVTPKWIPSDLSVRRPVGPSVGPSVGRWRFRKKNKENHYFRANNCRMRHNRQISCNHIIIQSFHHHEEASLALWAFLIRLSSYRKLDAKG